MKVNIECTNAEIEIQTSDSQVRTYDQPHARLTVRQEPCEENQWENRSIQIPLSEYQFNQLEAALRLLS
jgi:hypothetical protein